VLVELEIDKVNVGKIINLHITFHSINRWIGKAQRTSNLGFDPRGDGDIITSTNLPVTAFFSI
jgi:hypothetical protein